MLDFQKSPSLAKCSPSSLSGNSNSITDGIPTSTDISRKGNAFYYSLAELGYLV